MNKPLSPKRPALKNAKENPPSGKKSPKHNKISTKTLLHSNTYNGVLDITALSIDFTPVGEKFIKSIIGRRGNVKVYWGFMNFPSTSTPQVHYSSNHLDIKHTSSYEVAINETFLRYLSTRPITFEVYVINYRQEILMGKGDVIFRELLINPNECIEIKVEISNLEKALLVNNPTLFRIYAQLNVAYELRCDSKFICRLIQKKYKTLNIETFMHNLIENLIPKERTDDTSEDYDSDIIPEPTSQMQAVSTIIEDRGVIGANALKLKQCDSEDSVSCSHRNSRNMNERNEASSDKPKQRKHRRHSTFKRSPERSSTDEDIRIEEPQVSEGARKPKSLSSKRRVSPAGKLIDDNIKEKLGIVTRPSRSPSRLKKDNMEKSFEDIPHVRKSLEEYAIICGEDPTIINSPKWREANMSKIYIRNYRNHLTYYLPEVLIHIHYLKFYDHSAPVNDKTIKSFYLEYSFLSRDGVDMESASLLKSPNNAPLKFNFKKTFQIDILNNFVDCKLLANMIKQRKTIVIEAISEPIEDVREIQSCEIVGYCELSVFDLVQLEENMLKAKFELKNFQNPTDSIGYLRITIGGIQAMRNAILQMLAPTEFKQLQLRYAGK